MLEIAQANLKPAAEVTRTASLHQAPNGIRYGSYGDTQLSDAELTQIVEAVPQTVAAALGRKAYYFVPLTLAEPLPVDSSLAAPEAEEILIAPEFSSELSDNAICHRNLAVSGMECTFISTRIMQDRFALAFEFYINAGHHFVDAAGVPESFMQMVWSQAEIGVRGETSQDAWEYRMRALGMPDSGMEMLTESRSAGPVKTRRTRTLRIQPEPAATKRENVVDEKARTSYFAASFADAIAIYLLSLTVDFDYAELREREYPLLAAPALAERLRHVAQLFPPNAGQEFSIHYRRRNG